MDKLVLAEDTSNIDMSSDGLRKRKKEIRRKKAKKTISSSSSDENLYLNEDEENYDRSNKTLPDYPQIKNFVSCNNLHMNRSVYNSSPSILRKNNSYKLNDDDRDISTQVCTNNLKTNLIEKPNGDNEIENIYTHEYKKLVLGKLNKILYRLHTIENKFNILEEKTQPTDSFIQENNIHLPISTFQELEYFEEQLHEIQFKKEVLNIFQLVGGHTAHVMTRNILKKVITNNFAQNFSWAGKKAKKSFQELGLAQIIIQAVRKTYGHVTDSDIGESISKWLAQATLRIQRAKILIAEILIINSCLKESSVPY